MEDKSDFRSPDRLLIFAFILGPMAALTHLGVSYTLVPTACAQQTKTILHLCTVAFLIVAAIAAAISWRIYSGFADAEGVLSRVRIRWLSTMSLILAISSGVIILAMEIPNILLRSCD